MNEYDKKKSQNKNVETSNNYMSKKTKNPENLGNMNKCSEKSGSQTQSSSPKKKKKKDKNKNKNPLKEDFKIYEKYADNSQGSMLSHFYSGNNNSDLFYESPKTDNKEEIEKYIYNSKLLFSKLEYHWGSSEKQAKISNPISKEGQTKVRDYLNRILISFKCSLTNNIKG